MATRIKLDKNTIVQQKHVYRKNLKRANKQWVCCICKKDINSGETYLETLYMENFGYSKTQTCSNCLVNDADILNNSNILNSSNLNAVTIRKKKEKFIKITKMKFMSIG